MESEFIVFSIYEDSQKYYSNSDFLIKNIIKIVDFLRHCMVHNGSILLVDDMEHTSENNWSYLVRTFIVLIISFSLKWNPFDTLTYMKAKLLFFDIPKINLRSIIPIIDQQILISKHIDEFPTVSCYCKSCKLVLNKQFLNKEVFSLRSCTCALDNTMSQCPSNGCYNYIQDVQVIYIFT